MNPIPDAALAVIAAALDDYRQTTPPDTQTPHGAAQRAGEHLIGSGWRITPTPDDPPPDPTDQPTPQTTP